MHANIALETSDSFLTRRPSYLSLDGQQIANFLSGTGEFSERELGLFYQLCQKWLPEISYDKVVSFRGVWSNSEKRTLESLMDKLRQYRIGLMRWKSIENRRTPTSIYLCEQSGKAFYYHLLEDMYDHCSAKLRQQFPLLTDLLEQGFQLEYSDYLDYEQLFAYSHGLRVSEPNIYRINVDEHTAILLSDSALSLFISIAKRKINFYLSNGKIFQAIEENNPDISSLQLLEGINKDQAFCWKKICELLINNQDIVKGTILSPDESLIYSAVIIQNISKQKMIRDMEVLERQRQVQRDIGEIIRLVQNYPSALVLMPTYLEFFKRFQGRWGKHYDLIIRQIRKVYGHDPESTSKLGQLIFAPEGVIHRSRLYDYFLGMIIKVSSQIDAEYTEELRAAMVKRKWTSIPHFSSWRGLEEDARERLKARSSLLYMLLANEKILKALIAVSVKATDLEEKERLLNQRIAYFFHPTTGRIKSPIDLMDIRLLRIAKRSYRSLSLLERIFLYLLGERDRIFDFFEKFGQSITQSVRKDYRALVAPRRGNNSGAYVEKTQSSSTIEDYPDQKQGASREHDRERYGTSRQSKPSKKLLRRKDADSAWERFGRDIFQ